MRTKVQHEAALCDNRFVAGTLFWLLDHFGSSKLTSTEALSARVMDKLRLCSAADVPVELRCEAIRPAVPAASSKESGKDSRPAKKARRGTAAPSEETRSGSMRLFVKTLTGAPHHPAPDPAPCAQGAGLGCCREDGHTGV